MHLEILVEDQSGKILLEMLLPKILGPFQSPNSWRIKSYKGIGHIPKDLRGSKDPAARQLLAELPRLLKAYGAAYPETEIKNHLTSIIVIVDSDSRNLDKFLNELKTLQDNCSPQAQTFFQLAIEEMEAWLLGDHQAIKSAYPGALTPVLRDYAQDSICGTWEVLADAIYPGGSLALAKRPFFEIGQTKCEWAQNIGSQMNIKSNKSPSFIRFRDHLLKLASGEKSQ